MKKVKFLRQWINFYRIHYDFHFPYRLLVDGTFLKTCMDRKFEFKEKLTKLLHGQCWIQITPCVLAELRVIRNIFTLISHISQIIVLLPSAQLKEVYDFARNLPYLRCNHVDGLTPSQCIKDLVSNGNIERLWVMT